MTYLKILSYARRGIRAEIDNYRAMQEKALEGAGAHLDELQEIHDRK